MGRGGRKKQGNGNGMLLMLTISAVGCAELSYVGNSCLVTLTNRLKELYGQNTKASSLVTSIRIIQ